MMMSSARKTPSLTLPLPGGGDRWRLGLGAGVSPTVKLSFTLKCTPSLRRHRQSPPPRRGRVREGVAKLREGVNNISGFRNRRQRSHARALRAKMTEAEKQLWQHLRAHRFMGLSIRRQAPVGPYIVDFLIPSRNLVIEADGAQHYDPGADALRTAYLTARGYRVLRFSNADILTNLPGVLARLAEEVAT